MPMAVEASESLLAEGKSAADVVVQDAVQQKGVIGQLLRLRRLCGLHWCHLASWNGLKTMALGQLLAILLTTTGVTSSLLAQRGMYVIARGNFCGSRVGPSTPRLLIF